MDLDLPVLYEMREKSYNMEQAMPIQGIIERVI